MAKNNSDSVVFENANFGEIKDQSLRTTPIQKKKNWRGSFRYVSALRKNVFSGEPAKYFFLYGSNNSDSVVFLNAPFGKIKDHTFENITFSKKNSFATFRYVFNIRKKEFLGAPVRCLFYGSNNSDSVVFRNAGFGKMKDGSFENDTFSKSNFAMIVLGMCPAYVKMYFQDHQWSDFFVMAQITQILLFSGMLVSESSRITVWAQWLSKNFLNHELFV